MIDAAEPADVRVAGFNSGILSYYGGHPTVNLDGVMNADAYDAIQKRRLAEYVRDQRVDVVVDFAAYVDGEFGAYWGADTSALLARRRVFAGAGRTDFDEYVIYDVLPR